MECLDFILFDAFKKKDKFYLNMCVLNENFNKNKLLLCINNKILKFYKKIENTHKQCPVTIYIYDCDLVEPNNNYDITYKNIYFFGEFENILIDKKYNLTLTTLFKDDYKFFNLFYDYYKKQGVEHFYMYYNGVSDENIINCMKKKDVTLINWDFPYRYSNTKSWKKKKRKIIPSWTTISQFGQMHNALYKFGKYHTKYMIFCDIDEYLHVPNFTINKFVLDNDKDYYGFNNIWSKTIEPKEELTKIPNNILVSDKVFNYGNRSKNIYKVNKIKTIGIHKIFEEIEHLSCINNLKLYHFYHWTKNPARKNEIIECVNSVEIQY